jgi:cobalt-zinc-cadmium resistance protein CzcA
MLSMLDKFLHLILRQRLLTLLFGAIVLVTGLFAWFNMPIDAFPDVTNVQVMILAEAQGFSPEEVERLVTFPIEVQMSGLPKMRLVRSLSQSGLSQVVVIFEDDVDTNFARELVFQRLSVAQDSLPDGIVPKMGPISTGLGEIFQYTVESGFYCSNHKQTWSPEAGRCSLCNIELIRSDHDMMSLRTIQDWLISPELKKLPGINEINTMGGLVRQYHIIVDPDKLIKFGVELNDILEAFPGPFLKTPMTSIILLSNRSMEPPYTSGIWPMLKWHLRFRPAAPAKPAEVRSSSAWPLCSKVKTLNL